MVKPFKALYEFLINKKEKVEEITDNEDGSKTVRLIEKEVPHKFYIKRPTGNEKSAAELYQYKVYGEAVSAGVITTAILQKRVADEGGVLSREELKVKESIAQQIQRELADYKLISDKKEEDRTEVEKVTLAELDSSIQKLMQKLKQYESLENDLGMTAETLAQNKLFMWWVLNLLYKDSANGPEPLFPGIDYNDRQEIYSDIHDAEDTFLLAAISKGAVAIRCWMTLGKVSDEILKKIEENATN